MSTSLGQVPVNPLSDSATGQSYTGLACFPLGHHLTYDDVSEIVHTLHHLRKSKIIQPMRDDSLEIIQSHLRRLQTAKSFWSHRRDAHQAKTIEELLRQLPPDGEPDFDSLEIYQFPDSERPTIARVRVWGVYEFDAHTKKTILYISGKANNTASTVLHTFMTSRMCPRLQCFLAEYVSADQAGRLGGQWGLPARLQQDLDQLSGVERDQFVSRFEKESKLGAPILLEQLRAYCEELSEIGREEHPQVENVF